MPLFLFPGPCLFLWVIRCSVSMICMPPSQKPIEQVAECTFCHAFTLSCLGFEVVASESLFSRNNDVIPQCSWKVTWFKTFMLGRLHDKVLELALKLHSPTFYPLPLFFFCHFCLFLLYINGLALFTQQHAMCSMARWSDLGGMLRGLKEYVQ